MLAWAAIGITWLAATLSILKDFKRDSSGRWLSREALKRNRFALALGFLATTGFIVGGIKLEAERMGKKKAEKSEAEYRQRLDEANEQIATFTSLNLANDITPVLEIYFEVREGDLGTKLVKERLAWIESGGPEALPRPVGFLGPTIRNILFPGWVESGDELIDLYVGDLMIDSSLWHFQMQVRPDGSVVPSGHLPQNIEVLQVLADESKILLRCTLKRKYSALSIWRDLQQRAEEKESLVSIRVVHPRDPVIANAGSTAPWHHTFKNAQLRGFLTDSPEVVAVIPLSASPAISEGETARLSWAAAAEPKIIIRAVPHWAMK